ncbi:putative PIG3 family NAD(P)H quinone oxidoreductase [Motilibacter rhizosphaerae]|uniref:Putative PIG3 family NAD(P)H quinone oxidoreductase n=1 Tax=Motilibacter rhizosphaerae TaxID=598652 RepID=A0A4Q7NVP6_9ACTN|nr:NAD(P)H-quinone oxidoreductase [Motilibacter rhizosphaerae]RZS91343.1 putative PIG3 family NAD(P)H quinone oxidoreductase [Motilibacter rhizosphaerae]
MHAVVVESPGGPESLHWAEVPDPVPGPGDVLVDVVAAGLNRADLLQRQGHYPPPPGAPAYLGLECSGTVLALGEGVTGWQVGDEVCALLAGGGYAEQVAVPAGQLLPLPQGVPLDHAAALPEVACTVWSNLVMVAGLRAGETLLVHGGAGGIGTGAIQVAVALGATVVATAGTEEKRQHCRDLGAAGALDYRGDWVTELRESYGGADVVLDVMGASLLPDNVAALAVEGRLVVIGMQGGRKGELDLGQLMTKRASVHATALRSRPEEEKAAIVAQVREHVWPLVEAGRLRIVVDSEFPFAEAAEAHRRLESGGVTGKVLLTR